MWVTTNVGANIFTFIFYYKDQVLMNPFIAVGKDDNLHLCTCLYLEQLTIDLSILTNPTNNYCKQLLQTTIKFHVIFYDDSKQ